MSWNEIISLIACSGSFLGIITLFFKFGKYTEKIDKIEKDFIDVKSDLKNINKSIQSLDKRLARIEGQLNPPRWNPRIVNNEENK